MRKSGAASQSGKSESILRIVIAGGDAFSRATVRDRILSSPSGFERLLRITDSPTVNDLPELLLKEQPEALLIDTRFASAEGLAASMITGELPPALAVLLIVSDKTSRETSPHNRSLTGNSNLTPDEILSWSDVASVDVLRVVQHAIERKHHVLAEECVNNVLGLIAHGAPLAVILNALNFGIERASIGLLSSVLILERHSKRFRHISAPSLPEEFHRNLELLLLRRKSVSCAVTRPFERRVVIRDVRSGILSDDLRDSLERYGINAFFSVPIESSSAQSVGVLAGYFRVPRTPTDNEFRLCERAAQLAGIAVEKKCTDVALRKSREQLRTQRAQLQLTFDAASTGLITCKPSGEVIVANRAFCDMLGRSFDEVIGTPFHEFIAPEDRARISIAREELTQNRLQSTETELTLLRTNGQQVYAIERARVLRDLNGHVTQLVLEIENITAKKRWEAEQLRMTRLESVGMLASGLAHDFRNLLTGIIGATASMMRLGDGSDPFSRRLADIERGARRATELVEQLLNIARGHAGGKSLFSLPNTLREALHLVFTGTNISYSLTIADDVGLIRGEESQLSQVLYNLLLNARQAMPSGGRVEVRCESVEIRESFRPPLPSGHFLRISVTDEGPGIPPDRLERIFDPFFTTKPEGSGLGLSVSAHIVRQHGGWIEVNSTPGRGSTFSIFLPHHHRPSREEREAHVRADPSIPTSRILLMDDDQLVRETAGGMLSLLGYEVEFAADGQEALESYRQALIHGRPFAAVLLDLSVTCGMGGESTIGRLRAVDPTVRAIITSGYAHDPVMTEFSKYGFAGAVSKPFEIERLKRTIEEVVLARHRGGDG